ncbi:MAG TPA: flavodoxin domain-containing protein [Ignavibacteria bacterium]|nr:flavodoxin domain-containing protein [Ignavibacteria bacterium]HAX50134.1 flavodoxin [Bacteroidota bacterium]HRE09319.1 flavodoxin domain-containing protein [Ignavibacteria bacterium]HRF66278.1 flavodoxin domain-containing protein [Ignavibacteria bacterium]HRJ05079.1 flavodoxin domain-containing protein [Ignavibacteria bacterium]
MKTAIIFKTKHGTTEKVAYMLAKALSADGSEIRVIDLAKTRQPHLVSYERIIIGGSIHVGKIQREIRTFCDKHTDALCAKKLGLYICCMETDEIKRQKEFEDAFSEKLKKHASAKGIMGGEFLLEKMNFIERLVVRKIAHTKESVFDIDTQAVKKFISEIN